MPLTSKGKKIMASMKDQYGAKKGKQVFYASENKGTIDEVHKKALDDAFITGFMDKCAEVGVDAEWLLLKLAEKKDQPAPPKSRLNLRPGSKDARRDAAPVGNEIAIAAKG